MVEYFCKKCEIKTHLSECPNCHERTELKSSSVFWCDQCNTPLYDNVCPICGNKAKRISADLRPVFPQERLLMEIILGEPLKYLQSSVWSCSSQYYIVDGKKVDFSISKVQEIGPDKIREQLFAYADQNDERYFDETIDRFVKANQGRCNYITSEACDYIRKAAKNYTMTEMFVSMSGGKDSILRF